MPYYPELGVVHISKKTDLHGIVPVNDDARKNTTPETDRVHLLATIWADPGKITQSIDGLVAPAQHRPLLRAKTPSGEWQIIDQQTGTILGKGNTREEALYNAKHAT